jgi:hypothetical protein
MEQNFKIEIAEALFDSSVKVSKDALIWAMSNLPDSKNHGGHTTSVKATFDHKKENVFEACGMSEEDCQKAASVVVKQIRRVTEDGTKVSSIVEGVIEEVNKNPNVLMLIVVKSVQDALAHAEKMSSSDGGDLDKMMKMLRMLKRLKDDDKDNS